MAIHPFAALPVVTPIAAAPPITEPAMAVTPAISAAQQGRADSATSEPSRQQDPQCPVDAVEAINANMRAWSTNLRFEIDDELQRLVVSVIDSDSGDVLRTVPSEAVLRFAKMIASLQGKIIDTEA